MENKLYIGNLVSFEDTRRFVELIIKKENAKLYKISDKYYIDVTDIEDNEIENHILFIKDDKTKYISNMPVDKIIVDEMSLKTYKQKIYKLIR